MSTENDKSRAHSPQLESTEGFKNQVEIEILARRTKMLRYFEFFIKLVKPSVFIVLAIVTLKLLWDGPISVALRNETTYRSIYTRIARKIVRAPQVRVFQ